MTKRQQHRCRQGGFTLAELLIVVAIILVLVAIAIPVFNGVKERSSEATDLANIRSSYSELMSSVLQNDHADHYSNGEWVSDPIVLQQHEEGWQDEDTKAAIKSIGATEGEPLQNGSESATIHISLSGKTISTVIYFAPSWTRFNPSGKMLYPSWNAGDASKQIYGSSTDLTPEEKKIVDELKKQFSWDCITIDIRQRGATRFVSCINQPLKASDFAESNKWGSQVTAYRITFDSATGEVLKVVSEGGKWGVNGTQGVGFWGNTTTETLYEKK